MAQPIYCDADGPTHPADTLVTRIADGETLAWCDEHYVQVARAIAEAVDAAERAATDADALAQLGVTDEPAAFPTSADSSDADGPPVEPPIKPASGRKRTAVAIETANGADDAPGPNLGGVGDPDVAGAVPR